MNNFYLLFPTLFIIVRWYNFSFLDVLAVKKRKWKLGFFSVRLAHKNVNSFAAPFKRESSFFWIVTTFEMSLNVSGKHLLWHKNPQNIWKKKKKRLSTFSIRVQNWIFTEMRKSKKSFSFFLTKEFILFSCFCPFRYVDCVLITSWKSRGADSDLPTNPNFLPAFLLLRSSSPSPWLRTWKSGL